MIGIGPYIPHPATPLRQMLPCAPVAEQIPNTEKMTYKVIALTRLVSPEANIPSTTALATLSKADGCELGLLRGANIVMPNLTHRSTGLCTKSIRTRPKAKGQYTTARIYVESGQDHSFQCVELLYYFKILHYK
jgi:biotin synthase-like enzyme